LRDGAADSAAGVRKPAREMLWAVGGGEEGVLDCRDRDHLAVITLAPQPAEKAAFEQFGVETIGLGATVLARYRYARGVNDMRLDVARP